MAYESTPTTPIFGGMERTGNDVLASGSAASASYGELQPDQLKVLREWQEWIKIGKREVDFLKHEWERGDKLYRGEIVEGVDVKKFAVMDPSAAQKARYNGVKRRVDTSVNQLYAKNPIVTATVLKPIARQQMVPIVGPDGMPVIGMDGQPRFDMVEEDISEKRAEIVEAVMLRAINDAALKAEAKQAIFEAKVHHGGWMQVGYNYDEDNQRDQIFFRRREFCEVISDPCAKFYEGILRNCRFVAVRWVVTEEEAKSLGIDWDAIKGYDQNLEKDAADETVMRATVWQMWDGTRKVVGWACQHGDAFAGDVGDWPWQVDGFPFECLRLTKDSKRKWPAPPVLEAEYLQDEQNKLRETFNSQIVNKRPVNLFDPGALDKNTAQLIAGREKGAWIAVEGMSARQSPPIQTFNDDSVGQDEYAHFDRNEQALDVVLGTTPNDIGLATKASATEVSNISQRAEGNVDAERDMIDDWLKRIIRKAKQIMEQTITEEQIIEIVGKDGSRYWAPYSGDILAETDVDIEVGSTQRMNAIAKQQLDINMLGLAARVGPALNLPQMVIDTMKDHGKKNADKYLMQQGQAQAPMGRPPIPSQGAAPGAANSGPTDAVNPEQGIQQQLNPMV
jgi:hypothetical protein